MIKKQKDHRLCEGMGERGCQAYGRVTADAQGINEVPFVSLPAYGLSRCAIPSSPTHLTCCPCFLLIFTHHPITSPWSSTPAVPWSSEHYTEAFNPLQTPTQYFTIILFSTREATLNNYRQYFKHQISSSSRSAEDLQQIDLQLKSTVIFSLWVMFKSCLLRESQALSTGFVPRLAIIGVF